MYVVAKTSAALAIIATPAAATRENRLPMRAANAGGSLRNVSQKQGSPPSHKAAPSWCSPVASNRIPEGSMRATAWLVATDAQITNAQAAATTTRDPPDNGDRWEITRPV